MTTNTPRETEPTILGHLCGATARRKLLVFLLDKIESGGEEAYRTGELMEAVDVSRNSIRTHLDVFTKTGLLSEVETDGRFTKYRPTDNLVATVLIDCDEVLRETGVCVTATTGAALTDLYDGEARTKLTDYVIHLARDWDEDSDPLTKMDIHETTGVTRKSIVKEIDTLVAYNLLTEDTEYEYPRYVPALDSEQLSILYDGNVAINDYLRETERQ